jgi:hypothetical protein
MGQSKIICLVVCKTRVIDNAPGHRVRGRQGMDYTGIPPMNSGANSPNYAITYVKYFTFQIACNELMYSLFTF